MFTYSKLQLGEKLSSEYSQTYDELSSRVVKDSSGN